jgi:hypothetical protein
VIFLGPIRDRLFSDLHLQRILSRIHAAGVRPTAELIVQLLEESGAGPEALDSLEEWARLDADVVRALDGNTFPKFPPSLVPKAPRR